MPPKGSVTPAKRGHKEDVSSRKKSKLASQDSDSNDESDDDELAGDDEYNEGLKPKKATTRTRKVNDKSSPPSKAAPKTTRKRNPNSVSNLKKVRAEKNKELRILKEEKEAAEKNQQELKEQALRSQNHIHILRERELASKQQGGQYMQDDEQIRQSLNDLSKKISDFAAAWARKDMIAQSTDPDAARLTVKVLQGFHVLREGINEALIWQPGGSRLAVQTILEHIVAEQYLTRPFSFLAAESRDGAYPSEAALMALQSRMRDDCPDTILWPARTLRSLYASYQTQTSSIEPISEDSFEAQREAAREDLLRICLDGSEPLLPSLLRAKNSEFATKQRAGLSRIFKIAAKVSLQVWIQGIVPTVHWQDSSHFQKGFTQDHTHFDPHPLMQPDHNDESLVNQDIDWVVRPCVTFRRHHADGGQSIDLIALKAQVMLLNMEKCLAEEAKKPKPLNEPARTAPVVSPAQPPKSVANQHTGDNDTGTQLVEAQIDERDSDTIVVETAETGASVNPETESQENRVDEIAEGTGANVDHQVTDSNSTPSSGPISQRNGLESDALDPSPVVIDLTGDEPSDTTGKGSEAIGAIDGHERDVPSAVSGGTSNLSGTSRQDQNISVRNTQEKAQGQTVEEAKTRSSEWSDDSDLQRSQAPRLVLAVSDSKQDEITSMQQEESHDDTKDLASQYGFHEPESGSQQLTSQDDRDPSPNTEENQPGTSYIDRLRSHKMQTKAGVPIALLKEEEVLDHQTQLPEQPTKRPQDEAIEDQQESTDNAVQGQEHPPNTEIMIDKSDTFPAWIGSGMQAKLADTADERPQPEHSPESENDKIVSPCPSKDLLTDRIEPENETSSLQIESLTPSGLQHDESLPLNLHMTNHQSTGASVSS